jgi:hypothetical protein
MPRTSLTPGKEPPEPLSLSGPQSWRTGLPWRFKVLNSHISIARPVASRCMDRIIPAPYTGILHMAVALCYKPESRGFEPHDANAFLQFI